MRTREWGMISVRLAPAWEQAYSKASMHSAMGKSRTTSSSVKNSAIVPPRYQKFRRHLDTVRLASVPCSSCCRDQIIGFVHSWFGGPDFVQTIGLNPSV